jgi:hypothetical protein
MIEDEPSVSTTERIRPPAALSRPLRIPGDDAVTVSRAKQRFHLLDGDDRPMYPAVEPTPTVSSL